MNKTQYQKRLKQSKKIVSERIELLLAKAQEAASDDIPLANRYVTLARNLSMKYNVRIPSNLKKRFCKHCYTYLVQGVNCRVRTQKGKIVYACKSCHKFMRFPYTKEKKKA